MDMRYRPKARDRKKSLNVEADSCSRKIIWGALRKNTTMPSFDSPASKLVALSQHGALLVQCDTLGDPMKSWVYLSFKFI